MTPAELLPEYAEVQAIVSAVARATGYERVQLLGTSKAQPLARYRMACHWLARERTGLSLPALGRVFDRHHTSILHAVRATAARMAVDEAFRTFVEGIVPAKEQT